MCFATLESNAQDLQRGARNYYEIVAGKVTLESLSDEERNEVFLFYQLTRAPPNDSPDCQDAWSDAQSAASELASSASSLKQCAEAEDFDDDCGSEFRRVRSAHSDYESAASDVSSNCD